MISDELQEQAALHALGLLDAAEAVAFERQLATDGELRTLTAELRETTAELARGAQDAASEAGPRPELRVRVLAEISSLGGRTVGAEAVPTAAGKIVHGPWGGATLPWAIAAALTLCCGALAVDRQRSRKEFSALERKTAAVEVADADLRKAPAGDALRLVAFCPLEPQPPTDANTPRAAVLWDAARREGTLRLAHVPPAGAGKDYQLWVVETGHKDAVSAGVVSVDAAGTAQVPFRPVATGGTEPAAAFALSVERAGGSEKNEGPILFLGKL